MALESFVRSAFLHFVSKKENMALYDEHRVRFDLGCRVCSQNEAANRSMSTGPIQVKS